MKIVQLNLAWYEYPGAFLKDCWSHMVTEWHERTRFGKVLYPLWILKSVYCWLALFCFMGFLIFMAGVMKLVSSSPSLSSPSLPNIYKNGGDGS